MTVSNGHGSGVSHGNIEKDKNNDNHNHNDNHNAINSEVLGNKDNSFPSGDANNGGGIATAVNTREAKIIKLSMDLIMQELTGVPIEKAAKKKKRKKKMKRQLSLDSVGGDGAAASKRQELDRGGHQNQAFPASDADGNGNGNAGAGADADADADADANGTNKNTTFSLPLPSSTHEANGDSRKDIHARNTSANTPARQQPTQDQHSTSSPPPPGFNASMSSLKLDEPDRPLPLPTPIPMPTPTPIYPPHPHQGLPPHARFIVIPEQDRPVPSSLRQRPHVPPTNISLAIPAAKAFIDLYYSHITSGEYTQLSNYYTPRAQKSISVGGAHSVVATSRDIMLQLQSLARSIFVVRGVVSQDTYDGRGAHILVTGVVQTGGVLSQFAHTISLIPVPQHGMFSFQIHNDALSLLTTGD